MRLSILAALLAIGGTALHAQSTGNTTIQPDIFVPFAFAATGSFPVTPVANGAGDNRQRGAAAWTMVYQCTGFTMVSMQVDSGASVSTTVTFGAFAGTVVSGFANPIVSNTGGTTVLTNGTAAISWVRVTLSASGSGSCSGVLYGSRNSAAAANSATSGTVTAVSEACGITATPNPIITTGTVLSNGVCVTIANASVTGTTINKLAKLTGAPSTAVISGAGDTGGAIGIVDSGAGTTSSAVIKTDGEHSCVFDGATTAGHYVQISASVAGDCTDVGATFPTSGQVIGQVLSTNVGAGTYTVDMSLGQASVSAGALPAGSGTEIQYRFSPSAFGAITGSTYTAATGLIGLVGPVQVFTALDENAVAYYALTPKMTYAPTADTGQQRVALESDYRFEGTHDYINGGTPDGALTNIQTFFRHAGSGNVSDAANMVMDGCVSSGGGTITNCSGLIVVNDVGNGSTNQYGVRILDQSGSASNWAIQTGLGRVDFGDQTNIYKTSTDDGVSAFTANLTLGGVFSGNTAIYGFASAGGHAITGISVAQIDSIILGGGGGSLVNGIGLEVLDQTVATNNWSIKTGLGKVQWGDVEQSASVAFSALPSSPADGMQIYCSDCQVTTVSANLVSNATCKAMGSGSWAWRINGAWKCTFTP